MRGAQREVHGVAALDRTGVEAAGRTDGAIARDILLAAGVAGRAIDARAGEVAARAVAAYAELCPADLSGPSRPGIAELLDALAARPDDVRLSLVTGNFEPVARLKLRAAGIGALLRRRPGRLRLRPRGPRAAAGDRPRAGAGAAVAARAHDRDR